MLQKNQIFYEKITFFKIIGDCNTFLPQNFDQISKFYSKLVFSRGNGCLRIGSTVLTP